MQKRGIFVFIVLGVLFISLSSVYAFSFSDFFENFYGKITGNVVASGCPDNLVAYYKFDGNAQDSSGNGNDGKPSGTISYTDGKRGQAIVFDGSNSLNLGSIDLYQKSFTLSIWVKNPTSTSIQLFTQGGGCYGTNMQSVISNSYIDFGFCGSDVMLNNPNPSVNTAQWHLYTFVQDDSLRTKKLYIDGVLRTDNTPWEYGNGRYSGTGNFILGTDKTGAKYPSQIDEFAIFNGVLSADQIVGMYNSGSGKEACSLSPVIPPCTEENWQAFMTNQVCPVSGQITKGWTKIGNCTGGISHPSSENVSCNYVPLTPTCNDGIKNGNETGIDCGGSVCSPCASVSYCNSDSDCLQPTHTPSLFCENGQSCLYQGSSICINPSTDSSYCNLSQVKQCSPCINGCSDGVCKTEVGVYNCTDSESAVSYYVSGTVNINGKDYPDSCSGDLLIEYSCVSGSLFTYPAHNCSLEGKICSNGACIGNGSIKSPCEGCEYENKCLPVGYRLIINEIPSYCDIYGIAPQKVNEENLTQSCQNSYECSSNLCSSGECVELEGLKAMLAKILCKLTHFFDPEAERACIAENIYGACISNWDCTDWGACDGQSQTRVCNDTKSCTPSNNAPNLTQSCSIIQSPICGNGIVESGEECDPGASTGYGCNENCTLEEITCISSWNCTNWSICENELQNRTCNDILNCSPSNNAPNLTKSCALVDLCENVTCNENETCESLTGECVAMNCTDEQIYEILFLNNTDIENQTNCTVEQIYNFIINYNISLEEKPLNPIIENQSEYDIQAIFDEINAGVYDINESGKCVDGDFGFDFYVKANISGYLYSNETLNVSECPQPLSPPENYCSDGTLVQMGLDAEGCSQAPICVPSGCAMIDAANSKVSCNDAGGVLIFDGFVEGCPLPLRCEYGALRTTNSKLINNSFVENVSDFCISLNPLVDSGEYLVEGYCSGSDTIGTLVKDCGYGCFEGACLPSAPECTSSAFNDIYTAGYSSGLFNGGWYMYNQSDYCVDNLENMTAGLSGNYVVKYNCIYGDEEEINDELNYSTHFCENGCYMGACLKQQGQCLSPNGDKLDVRGESFGYLNGDRGSYVSNLSDFCYFDENYTSYVQKFSCDVNEVLISNRHACEYGCSEGRCLNQSDYDALMLQNSLGSYCLNVNITEPSQERDSRICLDALGMGCNNKTLLFNETNASKICYTDVCPTRNVFDELRCNYRILAANVSKVYNLWNTDYGDSYGNWVTARVNCSSNLCKLGPCDKYLDSNAPIINASIVGCAEGSDECASVNYLINYSLDVISNEVVSKTYRCDSCTNGSGINCVEANYYQDYLDSKCGDGIVQSWEECDNGTANIPAPSRVASCIGSPSCSNYNSDESTCNNALGGSVCSFVAGSGSYCGSSSGPYGLASNSYCNSYYGNEYDCTYSTGGNCVYDYITYNCNLVYTDCSHWNSDASYCNSMGCTWHDGIASQCSSSSERGCPWYKAWFGFCPEPPSCSLKSDKTGCVNSYGGACVFARGSSTKAVMNNDCEIGTCGDGTTYDKYVLNNKTCSPICYMDDPCEGHGGTGLFGISSGGSLSSIIGVKEVDDSKENCAYIPLSDGKLLISRELNCRDTDCINGNGKTCKPVQNISNYAFPGTTSHMNCADLGVSGVIERNGSVIRGPFAGKLKCNTECKIDTSDCRRLNFTAGEICLLSEIVGSGENVSSVDSKCDEDKGDVPCGVDIGRGCNSGQICKVGSSGSSFCVPDKSGLIMGGKVGACPAFCGDRIIDSGEECDGDNLNNTSCEDLGPYYGQLGCDSGCKFNMSRCNLDPLPPNTPCTYDSYPMQVCRNGEGCVDLSSDFWNCGSCNNICGQDETCNGGQCISSACAAVQR